MRQLCGKTLLSGLKSVHDLGLALWRDHVMRAAAIKPRVRAAVLGAINRERAGDQINQSLAGCCGCAG